MEPALGGEPSDIDEARKGELAAASESIEPANRFTLMSLLRYRIAA
jgi:hypothetical protein